MSDYVADNRDWLEPYFRTLQDALGLAHWIIDLCDGWPEGEGAPDEETTGACCCTSESYHRAEIYLGQDDYDPETLRHFLVHELMHCHLRDLMEAARGAAHLLPRMGSVVAMQRLTHEMEQTVDMIATAWLPSLPLPEMP